MNYEFKKFPFLTVALFAGVFTGFILGFVNLIFDLIYRGITDYSYSKIINALSIIILSVLLLLIAGLIYFFLVKYVKKEAWCIRHFASPEQFFYVFSWRLSIIRNPMQEDLNGYRWA